MLTREGVLSNHWTLSERIITCDSSGRPGGSSGAFPHRRRVALVGFAAEIHKYSKPPPPVGHWLNGPIGLACHEVPSWHLPRLGPIGVRYRMRDRELEF